MLLTAAIPPSSKGNPMEVVTLCSILGAFFAFGMLILKIIEVARRD